MELKDKRKLYLAALGISGMLTLTGCESMYGNQMDNAEKTQYFKTLDENYVEDSNLSYEIVSRLKVCFITNTRNVYIVIDTRDASGHLRYDYFTGDKINSFPGDDKLPLLIVDYPIDYFIEKYGFLKESYSEDDLKELLVFIKNDFTLKKYENSDGNLANNYGLVLKKENKR